MDFDTSEFIEEFINDMTEHLEQLQHSLLKIKSNYSDKALINEIFRVAHSIKGMSAAMEFKNMETLTHRMEDMLFEIRDDKLNLDDEIFSCLDRAYIYLGRMLESVENVGDEDEADLEGIDDLIKNLNDLLGIKEEVKKEKNEDCSVKLKDADKKDLEKAKKEGNTIYKFKILIADESPFKLVRAFIILKSLRDEYILINSNPDLEDLEDSKIEFDARDLCGIIASKKTEDQIYSYILKLAEIEDAYIIEAGKDFENFDHLNGDFCPSSEEDEKDEEIELEEFKIDKADKKKIEKAFSKNKRVFKILAGLDKESAFKSVRAVIFLKAVTEKYEMLKASPSIEWISENSTYQLESVKAFIASEGIGAEEIKEFLLTMSEISYVDVEEQKEGIIDTYFSEKIELEENCNNSKEMFRELNEKLEEMEIITLDLEAMEDNSAIISIIEKDHLVVKELFSICENKEIMQLINATEKLLEFFTNAENDFFDDLIDTFLNSILLLKKVSINSNILKNKLFSEKIEDQIKEINFLVKENNKAIGEILKDNLNLKDGQLEDLLEKQKTEYPDMKIGKIAVKENKASSKDVVNALKQQKRSQTTKNDEQIKISLKKADGLIDMLEELIMLQAEVSKEGEKFLSSDSNFMKKMLGVSRITKEIQNLSISFRMVSLKSVFQRVKITLRDTMKKINKKAKLLVTGEETLVDRMVANEILDPMLHMVKNSLSHGIETEKLRLENGKERQGTIKINAFSQKGYVYIEISDDGQGINLERVYNKAKEKELIDINKNYSNEEIVDFIFLPGFSTAEQVDKIAGRGVGMDVVKTKILKLGGKIRIENDPGNGSKFILRLPKNMTALNGTIVNIHNANYVIPTNYIKEIFKLEKEHKVSMRGYEKVVRLRNEIIPIIPISEIFDYKNKEECEKIMIVVEVENNLKAIPVMDILERRELVVKSLGEEFENLPYIFGATILGDGKASLILNIENLFVV